MDMVILVKDNRIVKLVNQNELKKGEIEDVLSILENVVCIS